MTKEQKLNKQVDEQQKTIQKLSGRMMELVDRISVLESDVGQFKQNVSNDMRTIVERVREIG